MNEKQILMKLLIEENLTNDFKTFFYFNNIHINDKGNDSSFDPLTCSIECNSDNEITKFLINQYENVNYEFKKNKIPLFISLENRNFYITDILLRRGANINYCNCNKENVLFYLYKNKKLNKKILRYLINNGIDINYKNKKGHSILNYIIDDGNAEFFKIIIEQYSFNNKFIIECLTASKFKKVLSSQDLYQWINKDKHQLKISENMIKQAVHHWNIDIMCDIILHNFNYSFLYLYNKYSILPKVTKYNRVKIVKYLVNNGAYINRKDQDGNTSLLIASKEGFDEIVKFLVDKNAKVNKFNNVGCTSLMCASQEGHLSIVQYLLSHGADINMKSKNIYNKNDDIKQNVLSRIKTHIKKILGKEKYGWSALMFAAQNGHLKIVRYLCDQGAVISEKNDQGCNALMIAAEYGHLDVLEYLHNQGLSIHVKNREKMTALILAAKNGHLPIVQYLVKHGAKIDKRDSSGKNAMIYASQMGYKTIMEYLYQQSKAMKIWKLKIREMALLAAIPDGHLDIIKYLYEQGTRLDCKNKQGENPIILASGNGHLDIVEFLYEHGASINEKCKNKKTAMMYACKYGHITIVRFLYEHGAALLTDTDNYYKKDALQIACKYGHLDIVKFLIECGGMKIPEKNYKEKPPLHLASKCGHFDIVKYLLDHGSDIHEKDNEGNSSLMLAARRGHKDIVLFLLSKGALINEQNNNGFTSLMYASQNGYFVI
ncbi:ankyrin [Neocallimastix sp. 'constans']